MCDSRSQIDVLIAFVASNSHNTFAVFVNSTMTTPKKLFITATNAKFVELGKDWTLTTFIVIDVMRV